MCVYVCIRKEKTQTHFFSPQHIYWPLWQRHCGRYCGNYKGESSTGLALRELKSFSFTTLEYCQTRGRKKCMIILSNFHSVLRKAENYIWNWISLVGMCCLFIFLIDRNGIKWKQLVFCFVFKFYIDFFFNLIPFSYLIVTLTAVFDDCSIILFFQG